MTSVWQWDAPFVESIVSHLKSDGTFDLFRYNCLEDVDTKPSYQNLIQRIEGFVTKFLSSEEWNPDLNKNELRNKLRRQIEEAGNLASGVDHVVDQVVNPKINRVFMPKVEEVVSERLNSEKNKAQSGSKPDEKNLIKVKTETSFIKEESTSSGDNKHQDSSKLSSGKSALSQKDVKSSNLNKSLNKAKLADKERVHKPSPKLLPSRDSSKSTDKTKDVESIANANLKTADLHPSSRNSGKSSSERKVINKNDERDKVSATTADSRSSVGKQKEKTVDEKNTDHKSKVKTPSSSSKSVPSSKPHLHKEKVSSKSHSNVKEPPTSKSSTAKTQSAASHSSSDEASKSEISGERKHAADNKTTSNQKIECSADNKKQKEVIGKKPKISTAPRKESSSLVESGHREISSAPLSSISETDESVDIDEVANVSNMIVSLEEVDRIKAEKLLKNPGKEEHSSIAEECEETNKDTLAKEDKASPKGKMETSCDKEKVNVSAEGNILKHHQEKVNNMNPTLMMKAPKMKKQENPQEEKASLSEPSISLKEKEPATDSKCEEKQEDRSPDVSKESRKSPAHASEEEAMPPAKRFKKSKEIMEAESADSNPQEEKIEVEDSSNCAIESEVPFESASSSANETIGDENYDRDSELNMEPGAFCEPSPPPCVLETVVEQDESPISDACQNLPSEKDPLEKLSPEGSANPRWESRRKRKLNPKYASSEYMSIFDDATSKQEESTDIPQTNPSEASNFSKTPEGSVASLDLENNPDHFDLGNTNASSDFSRDGEEKLDSPEQIRPVRQSKRLRLDSGSISSDRKKSTEMLETSSDSDNLSQKGYATRRRRSHSSESSGQKPLTRQSSTSESGRSSSRRENLRQRPVIAETKGPSLTEKASKNSGESQKNISSKSPSTSRSSKRYDSSDLYKPRLAHSSSRRNKS